MPLSGHGGGTYPQTSSHATSRGTFGHSRLSSLSHCGLILAKNSGLSVRELIFTLKKKKKHMLACVRLDGRTFSQNSSKRGLKKKKKKKKSHHYHHYSDQRSWTYTHKQITSVFTEE